MLHKHVMEYFDRIEFESGSFQNIFFGSDFLGIVNRHPSIVKKPLKEIYSILSRLNQSTRSLIIQQIRDSNKIEEICDGSIVPIRLDKTVKGLRWILREFFIKLYTQVIDGKAFRDEYNTTLKEHFNEFRRVNSDTTLCPTCGIGELKMSESKTRDQYDHFFPKALYPFSSVNFENLVLSCKECNSPDAKGEKDTVGVSTGHIFYPFNFYHKQLTVAFNIITDNSNPADIVWNIDFSCIPPKNDEIQSWKSIYDIDIRYKDFVKGRVEKWYRFYWEFMNDNDLSHIPENDRKITCLKAIEIDEKLQLSFIRKPVLDGFLRDSVLAKAVIEANQYI